VRFEWQLDHHRVVHGALPGDPVLQRSGLILMMEWRI
jgi:hypothetical protein